MDKGASMNEDVVEFKKLTDIIIDRQMVAESMPHSINGAYLKETDRLIGIKKDVSKKVEIYYENKLQGRVGKYETLSEFYDRMEATCETDENGEIIFEYYKLGITAIDKEFFKDKGVFQSSFIVIGAESGTGKTSLCLNIISNLAYQDVRCQFYSFEMGDRQFFNEISPQAKNKLSKINETKYGDNLSLDFHSRDVNDLALSIQMRAEDGVKVFVIDSYLSIYVNGSDREKHKMLTDMLATMKKELGILIILITQISVANQFNDIDEFKDGGEMKYESDVAIFIKFLNNEKESTKRHIICGKNRIFEDRAHIEIVTDYNRETHKIEKLCDYKDYNVDKDGKPLKELNWGSKGR